MIKKIFFFSLKKGTQSLVKKKLKKKQNNMACHVTEDDDK